MSVHTTSHNRVADPAGIAHDAHTRGTASRESGRLVLLRHGQTAWSISGQHTGRTDIPLTEQGRRQAVQAAERLRREFPQGFAPDHVFVSPLRAEGRTLAQIGDAMGRPWNLWSDGTDVLDETLEGDHEEILPNGDKVNVHNGTGETLAQVAARAKRVVDELMPALAAGNDVLLVAHAHILRILATQWLGVDPKVARLLRLETAHYCVLGVYRGDRVIDRWNV